MNPRAPLPPLRRPRGMTAAAWRSALHAESRALSERIAWIQGTRPAADISELSAALERVSVAIRAAGGRS